ncbi:MULTISPECIES: hypothetical protein [unclassified Paraburkholderia]|uniref:hypothetical protein n=1 Tax=unclassified Paraburkholderia TaxID=2615204 RepID=UPI002AB08721|nr:MULTISPECIES: hypothetical protein [unclassified Paraburkholderia]
MSDPDKNIHQIFAEAFKDYGPPFDRTPFFEFECAGLQEIRALLRHALSLQWRAYGERGLIHLDFIHNQRFNALATRSGDHELIAIFSGALRAIYQFWFFFMCDPLAMPHIGDPTKETTDKAIAAAIRSGDLHPKALQHPHDETRYVAAQNLALATCFVLANHEVGHIASCHPHYLQAISPRRGVYEELPAVPRSNRAQKLRQAMELEADEYAGGVSFQCLHSIKEMLHGVGNLDMGYVWSAASTALFLMIHKQSGRGIEEASATHPAPVDRWLLSLEMLLKSERCKVFNPDTAQITAGFQEVEAFWHRHALLGDGQASAGAAGVGGDSNAGAESILLNRRMSEAAARINVTLKGLRKIGPTLNAIGAYRVQAAARYRDDHRAVAHEALAQQLKSGAVRREPAPAQMVSDLAAADPAKWIAGGS